MERKLTPTTYEQFQQPVGSAIHFEFHMKILQHKAVQRSLIAASYDVMRMAHDESLDMEQLMDSSQSRIYDVMKEGMHDRMTSVREKLNSVINGIEKTQSGEKKLGVPTGYAELDKISMGWQPGNLIVIGARPGIGKTAIALNLAANASILGHVPVAFFSLEMTDIELMMRLDTDDSATEIIVAKNRNGAVGSIPLTYLKDIVKFVEPDNFYPGGDDFAVYESGMNKYDHLL